MNTPTRKKQQIGLALGSGSARGMSHIGIIRELIDLGIEPDIVCGTSIGAMVGAFYVCGKLDEFEDWVRGLSQWDVVQIMDISLIASGGGFMEGEKLMKFFCQHLGDTLIEDLPKPFATVATNMETGQEVWFTEGPIVEAVRASIALPVLLTPIECHEQWMLDGGLVNPVPVSVCRALGATDVIAVNLNGELVGKHFKRREDTPEALVRPDAEANILNKWASELKEGMTSLVSWLPDFTPDDKPGMFDVLATFINIMQDRITRSRMAGDPPDIMLVPRLKEVGLLDFDKAAESIEAGRTCVRHALPHLQDHLGI